MPRAMVIGDQEAGAALGSWQWLKANSESGCLNKSSHLVQVAKAQGGDGLGLPFGQLRVELYVPSLEASQCGSHNDMLPPELLPCSNQALRESLVMKIICCPLDVFGAHVCCIWQAPRTAWQEDDMLPTGLGLCTSLATWQSQREGCPLKF